MEHTESVDPNLQTEVNYISKEIYKNICHLNPQTMDQKFLTITIKSQETKLNQLSDSNIQKAKTNLSFEPDYANKIDKLLKTNEKAGDLYRSEYFIAKHIEILADVKSGRNLTREFSEVITKLETQSEDLEAEFLNGTLRMDEFTKLYMEKRTQFYTNKFKLEKIEKMGFL
ncbi:hypothetical protein HZS_3830 [Henneguya salminicola]|nr:hypothetical protein HZS_3830 [Henneguya salminicola]